MALDISSILSTYGSRPLNTNPAIQTNAANNTNFSDLFLNALSGSGTSSQSNEETLLSALTSSSNANLVQGLLPSDSSMNLFTDYLTNTTREAGAAFSSSLDDSSTPGINHQMPGSGYFSDVLTSSLQSELTSMMTNAKVKLEDNMIGYIEKTGENPSPAVQQTISRMQNNISSLDNFISERKMENSLLDALNANSSLKQYLINKNRTSAL